MFFKSIAFATFASIIAADQSFTLKAVGGGVDTPVTDNNGKLGVNVGSAITFTLQEPAGYLTAGSNGYVLAGPDGLSFVATAAQASNAFGIANGKLRAGNADSGSQWSIDSNTIFSYFKTGATNVDLVVDGAAPASSSSAPVSSTQASSEPVSSSHASSAPVSSSEVHVSTSEAPVAPSSSVGYSNVTYETLITHTTLTITSCAATVTNCPARTTVVPVTITTPVKPVEPTSYHNTTTAILPPKSATTISTSAESASHSVSTSFKAEGVKAISGAGAFIIAAAAMLM